MSLLVNRKIEVEVSYLSDTTLLLSGKLVDSRPRCFRLMVGGSVVPKGTAHDMTIDMEVTIPDLTITAARAGIACCPYEECLETVPGITVLVGMRVTRGFVSEVKRRLGGPRGCAHLVNLTLAMGPMALQGASVVYESMPRESRVEATRGYFVNTCRTWREDGPLVQAPHGASPGKRSA